MPDQERYIAGVPCWVDTNQPDPEAALPFYSGLFGWDFENVMPEGSGEKYFIGMPVDNLEGRCKETFAQVMNSGFPGGLVTVDKAAAMMDEACLKKN